MGVEKTKVVRGWGEGVLGVERPVPSSALTWRFWAFRGMVPREPRRPLLPHTDLRVCL